MENYQIFYTEFHRVRKLAGKVAIEGEANSKLDLLLAEIEKGKALEGIDFTDIDFTGATITKAKLYNCEFPQMNNVTFDGGINSCRFGEGATNCKFIGGVNIASAGFLGQISNCDFSGAKLRGDVMYFIKATLDQCNFSGFGIASKAYMAFQASTTVNNCDFSAIRNLRIDSGSTPFNNCNFSKSTITRFTADAGSVNNPTIDKTKNKSGETIDFLGESLIQRIMLFEAFVSSKKN